MLMIVFPFLSHKTVNRWTLLFPPSFLLHPTGGGSEPAAVLCLAACWIKAWHPCMDPLPTGPLLRCQGSGNSEQRQHPPASPLFSPSLAAAANLLLSLGGSHQPPPSLYFPDDTFPCSSAPGCTCMDRLPRRCWVSQAPSSTVGCLRSMARSELALHGHPRSDRALIWAQTVLCKQAALLPPNLSLEAEDVHLSSATAKLIPVSGKHEICATSSWTALHMPLHSTIFLFICKHPSVKHSAGRDAPVS